jgi:hypothetical protein
LADGGIDPATWATIYRNEGMWGPNKYTQFPGRIPMAETAGPATDARGREIPGAGTVLGKLANPGHVTTPGGYDHSAQTPSVLNTFLAAHGPGGQGAGGYNNQPFFDTLNALQGATGSTAVGGGASPAQMAQSEVDARNALPPEAPITPTPAAAAPAAATPGTSMNTMGGSEAERQLAGWAALDPIDVGPNALQGLDRSLGTSMATMPLGQRMQNAQAGNIAANMPQVMGGALSSGGMGSALSPMAQGAGGHWLMPVDKRIVGHGDGGG